MSSAVNITITIWLTSGIKSTVLFTLEEKYEIVELIKGEFEALRTRYSLHAKSDCRSVDTAWSCAKCA